MLGTIKAEQLRVNQWRDKEATRDAVRSTISDFLYSDKTGLPDSYSDMRPTTSPSSTATSGTRTPTARMLAAASRFVRTGDLTLSLRF
jgi:hypothetical protein